MLFLNLLNHASKKDQKVILTMNLFCRRNSWTNRFRKDLKEKASEMAFSEALVVL